MGTVRLIEHEAAPKCGSYEVRFPDSKSVYFIGTMSPAAGFTLNNRQQRG